MVSNESSRQRILLAIDTGSLTRPALEAAAALAVGLRTDLAALFVEDEQLLRLAALPFAHELGFPSAKLRRIGLRDMEKAFRTQAEQLRRTIENTAQRLTLAWTLDVARGEILSASLARLQPQDLLVVGKGRRGGFALRGARAGEEPFGTLAARPVMAVFDGSDATRRALEAGLALANVIAAELVVLIPAEGPEPFRLIRQSAGAWLAERGGAARYLSVAGADLAAIARAVRSLGAGAVVLATPATQLELRALAELLEYIACPLVLLR